MRLLRLYAGSSSLKAARYTVPRLPRRWKSVPQPSGLSQRIDKQAGLLGVSGESRHADLLARETEDPHTAEAVTLFCYRASSFAGKFVGASFL